MALSLLRSTLPRSLLPRAILILIVPLLTLQMVVAVVFVQRHYEGITRQMTASIARELAVAQQVIDTSPTAEIAQLRLENLSRPLAIGLQLFADMKVAAPHRRAWYDLSGRVLIDELETLLGPDLSVDLASSHREVDALLQTDKGALRAIIPRLRVTASNPHQLLVLMAITALVLAVIAILFLRNQMRPIQELSQAADAFGKGRSVPYRPAGAEEVRRAGNAFLSMRGRIERAIEQRTLMLSGVSHDLRTPLTRMKLTLAMIEDDVPEAHDMARDVDQMERMLSTFLDFARGDQMEDMEETDLVALLHHLGVQAERAGTRIETRVEGDETLSPRQPVRATALTRALENIVANAARHGSRVRLTLRLAPRAAVFLVEDDGPGVPPQMREEVLRPFTRLDTARNQDKGGGVGLGLAIALDVARAHGGALVLGDSADLGGLKCTFRLPR